MNTSTGLSHNRPKRLVQARILALTSVAIYALCCAALWWFQEQLIFKPSSRHKRTPTAINLTYEDVYIDTADQQRLHAWFVPAPQTAAAPQYVLFFHGNGGNISYRIKTLGVLHKLGHHVLMVDYRGYGQSSGSPSEAGLFSDARAAWQYLVRARGASAQDIVLYGRSLGGGVATYLASITQPLALIVESSFASLGELAAERYPLFPVAWLLRHPFNSAAYINEVRSPVLIAHSPDDHTIPFASAERLRSAYPGEAQFIRLRGDHNSAFLRSGESFYRALGAFITQAGAALISADTSDTVPAPAAP